jgi:hypothetical protein
MTRFLCSCWYTQKQFAVLTLYKSLHLLPRGRTLPEIYGKVKTFNKSPSIDCCVRCPGVAALNSISYNPILHSTCLLLGLCLCA